MARTNIEDRGGKVCPGRGTRLAVHVLGTRLDKVGEERAAARSSLKEEDEWGALVLRRIEGVEKLRLRVAIGKVAVLEVGGGGREACKQDEKQHFLGEKME